MWNLAWLQYIVFTFVIVNKKEMKNYINFVFLIFNFCFLFLSKQLNMLFDFIFTSKEWNKQSTFLIKLLFKYFDLIFKFELELGFYRQFVKGFDVFSKLNSVQYFLFCEVLMMWFCQSENIEYRKRQLAILNRKYLLKCVSIS